MTIEEQNEWLLQAESMLLNFPRCIRKEDVDGLIECGIDSTTAVCLLAAGMLGLDVADNPNHRMLMDRMLQPSLRRLDNSVFGSNRFLHQVLWTPSRTGTSEMKMMQYEPYELMPCGDLEMGADGRLKAPIGFFEKRWEYPALLEGGRIWMSVTPNEIITMENAIEKAHGKVAVLGLGMGYFTAMIADKPEVEEIKVIELNHNTIELIINKVIPQLPNRQKISIIKGDAIEYLASGKDDADFVFADIWHDVSDGLEPYQKMKKLEHLWPHADFSYWIEDSLKIYSI